MHPNAPFIKRPGEVDAWDNAEFRAAVKATGAVFYGLVEGVPVERGGASDSWYAACCGDHA